jgi:hypothetical protein
MAMIITECGPHCYQKSSQFLTFFGSIKLAIFLQISGWFAKDPNTAINHPEIFASLVDHPPNSVDKPSKDDPPKMIGAF